MSGWKLIKPSLCDICFEPAIWMHAAGGLRCHRCPRPEMVVPGTWESFNLNHDCKKGGCEGHCHAARDGECGWKDCPQLRDDEPETSSRSCPLAWSEEEEM